MRRIVIRRASEVKNFDDEEAHALAKAGASVRQILSAPMEGPPERAKRKRGHILLRRIDGSEDSIDAEDVLELIEYCWERNDSGVRTVTPWEENFLDSIQARVEAGHAVTEKQLNTLDRITMVEDIRHVRF